jgi:hypothetical protein
MREIRQSGSEGGVAGNGHPYPYVSLLDRQQRPTLYLPEPLRTGRGSAP